MYLVCLRSFTHRLLAYHSCQALDFVQNTIGGKHRVSPYFHFQAHAVCTVAKLAQSDNTNREEDEASEDAFVSGSASDSSTEASATGDVGLPAAETDAYAGLGDSVEPAAV